MSVDPFIPKKRSKNLGAPKANSSASAGAQGHPLQITPTDEPCLFMTKLNKDVRYIIYKLLLKSNTPEVEPKSQQKRVGWSRITKLPEFETTWFIAKSGISAAICRTNRVIGAESLPVLYGMNTFLFTKTRPADFCRLVGANRLLINKVNHDLRDFCVFLGTHEADELYRKIYHLSLKLRGLDLLSNVRSLTIDTRKPLKPLNSQPDWEPMLTRLRGEDTKEFREALAADDSDVVIALLKARLKSITELKILGFPPEVEKRIFDFWKSGKKYVEAGEAEESRPVPAKPVRPLPVHSCLSCQECKCVGAKPIQPQELGEVRDQLRAINDKMASGTGIRVSNPSIKLLQKFSEKFL